MHCSSVHIAATSPGHTLVTISVTGHEEHVWSSATFAAYEPLKVSHPRGGLGASDACHLLHLLRTGSQNL